MSDPTSFNFGFGAPAIKPNPQGLADALAYAQSLKDKVKSNLADQLAPVQQTVSDLGNTVQGALQHSLFPTIDKITKIADKVTNNLGNSLAQTYGYAAALGIPLPTDTQLMDMSQPSPPPNAPQPNAPQPVNPADAFTPTVYDAAGNPVIAQQPNQPVFAPPAAPPDDDPNNPAQPNNPQPRGFNAPAAPPNNPQPGAGQGAGQGQGKWYIYLDITTSPCSLVYVQSASPQNVITGNNGQQLTWINTYQSGLGFNRQADATTYATTGQVTLAGKVVTFLDYVTRTFCGGLAVPRPQAPPDALQPVQPAPITELNAPPVNAPPQAPTDGYVVVYNCKSQTYFVIDAGSAQDNVALFNGTDWQVSPVYQAPDALTAQQQGQFAAVGLLQQCPAPPPPNAPPVIDCSAWAGLIQGTDEWFANIDTVMNQMSQYGKWVLEFLLGFKLDGDCNAVTLMTPDPTNNELDGLFAALSPGNQLTSAVAGLDKIAPSLKLAIKGLVKSTFGDAPIVSGVADQMIDNLDPGAALVAIKSFLCANISALSKCGVCNWTSLVGLYAVRLMLTMIESFSFDIIIGINFIAEAWMKPRMSMALKLLQVQRLIEGLIEYACPSKMPDVGQSLEIYKYNQVTDQHFNHLMKWNGMPELWSNKLKQANREKLSAHELIEFIKRHPENGLDPAEQIRNLGYTDKGDAAIVAELYNKFPDTKQLLHFLQRNVFNTEYVKNFELLKGFSDDQTNNDVLTDIGTIGGNKQVRPLFLDTFQKYLNVAGIDRTLAALEYAAHWLPVPRELGAEMTQRLRPGRVDPTLEFTQAQYRQTLVEQDVPPWALDRYIALTYSKLNQRFIKGLYDYSVITKPEVQEYLRDNGFKETDAKLIADFLERQKAIIRTTQYHGYDVAKITELYKAGILKIDDARLKLGNLGFTTDEVSECLHVCSDEIDANLLKLAIANIARCYVKGHINDATALQNLVDNGLDLGRARTYLIYWQQERTCEVKQVNAHEVVDELRRHLISPNAAATRLLNMDYDADAVGYYLAVATADIKADQTKASTAHSNFTAAQAKALASQIKLQQRRTKDSAKIKLNLDKAALKAQEIINKADLQDQIKQVKAGQTAVIATTKQTSKDTSSSNLAADRAANNDKLKAEKHDYNDKVATRKGQLALDLANTTDKVTKAQLHADALTDLATLKDATAANQTAIKGTSDASKVATLKSNQDALQTALDAIKGRTDNATAKLYGSLVKLQVALAAQIAAETASVQSMP